MSTDEILNAKQVAELLGFKTRQSVYNLIAAGLLRASNVGIGTKPVYRIKRRAVADFLAKRATGPKRKRTSAEINEAAKAAGGS